jgi:competence protein ComEC
MKKYKNQIIAGVITVLIMTGTYYHEELRTGFNHLFYDEYELAVDSIETEIVFGHSFIHFIDVGQGDAILIDLPDYNMLIDGGGRNRITLEYLQEHNIEKLELVIGTHPHADHIGGLQHVFNSIATTEVIDPFVSASTKTYTDYVSSIAENEILHTAGRAGEKREVGEDIYFKILHPEEPTEKHLNDASVVIKLRIEDVVFLFMGDAEIKAEEEILERGYNLKANVLKAGHHGSRTSSSERFIDSVQPDYVVIMSKTGNRYKHPHEETLNLFLLKNIKVLRTDTHGTVVFSTDGKEVRTNKENKMTISKH